MTAPLDGLVVADLSSGIAGAYATKLLADGGAAIVKVEAPDGDPLRRWAASGARIEEGEDGALFNHLCASKQSVVVDPDRPADLDALAGLLSQADAALWSPGSALVELPSLEPPALHRDHPHLVVTAITPFGLDTPWSDRPATDLTLQAWSGGVVGLARGHPDHPPVAVGGQIGEWLSGAFAAVGTLAALRRADAAGELVDVSTLEAMAMCLTYYPVSFNDQLGRPMRKRRFVPTPGVALARDGLVGLGCGTGQQWLDFCVMVGHPEWQDDPKLFLERTALGPTIDAWIAERSVADVLDEASTFRIPNAPIVDGANAPTIDHFEERGTFVKNPRDGATNPRPPFRLSSTDLRPPEAAPRLGEHSIDALTAASGVRDRVPRAKGPLPFSGLRVLDMTAYWAGPFVGHLLALLGAEVIHLESAKRPDGVRMVGGVPQTEDRYWERGPIFSALNAGKKSLTIDFADPRGVDLIRRFVGSCDAVVENYTPRVLDQVGLGYEQLRQARPDLVMVRMPGFGLDGPWRDLAAFAFVIEDASGLTWITGHPDLLPIEPYCVGDPNAGLHALLGLQLALAHRDRTGEGCLVEAAMVDAALNVAAEQVVEHSAYGVRLERSGNRGPAAAPQNLYRTADLDAKGRADTWVAVAVARDEQWEALRHALDDPGWAAAADLASHDGRVRAHDLIDTELAAWCGRRSADDVVDTLWGAGVPVGKVMQPHEQPALPPIEARGFFESLDHPVIGSSRYSTLPLQLSRGPARRTPSAAPLLGEHNAELLGALGLTPEEIDDLEAAGIIGHSLTTA